MLEPFLKWAGGKRWLVFYYANLFPKVFDTYCEPFLGSGAVFFHVLPKRARLSDSNADLINAYQVIKKYPNRIWLRLRNLQKYHSHSLYYIIRDTKPQCPVTQAERFIYLNHTCFNGIYRVNRDGNFNVPIGSKALIEMSKCHLEQISSALNNSTLKVCDFEQTIAAASKGDFVYADPPYTVMHNNNNFIKYNSQLFSWDDQIRLSRALKEADRRGVLIMLSNANHGSISSLYKGFGSHHIVSRWSKLAADPEHRQKATELLITNY